MSTPSATSGLPVMTAEMKAVAKEAKEAREAREAKDYQIELKELGYASDSVFNDAFVDEGFKAVSFLYALC